MPGTLSTNHFATTKWLDIIESVKPLLYAYISIKYSLSSNFIISISPLPHESIKRFSTLVMKAISSISYFLVSNRVFDKTVSIVNILKKVLYNNIMEYRYLCPYVFKDLLSLFGENEYNNLIQYLMINNPDTILITPNINDAIEHHGNTKPSYGLVTLYQLLCPTDISDVFADINDILQYLPPIVYYKMTQVNLCALEIDAENIYYTVNNYNNPDIYLKIKALQEFFRIILQKLVEIADNSIMVSSIIINYITPLPDYKYLRYVKRECFNKTAISLKKLCKKKKSVNKYYQIKLKFQMVDDFVIEKIYDNAVAIYNGQLADMEKNYFLSIRYLLLRNCC